jgi:hypothetical protein
MKLEKQVCSLELFKKLKELGVKQKSHFYWKLGFLKCEADLASTFPSAIEKECISAYSVAELGEMLPERIVEVTKIKGSKEITSISFYHYDISEQLNNFYGWDEYRLYTAKLGKNTFKDQNEAYARAKILIYLLEQKLITL